MQDIGQSAGKIANKGADEILVGAFQALPGVDVPPHITHFPSITFVNPCLFDKWHHILLNQWLSTRRATVDQLKVEVKPTVECSATALTLKYSDIFRRDAGREVSAARPGGKGSIVR